MYTKQHLISILGYIGIGFIGGSISHGFFSGTRSIIMAILGILLFIISEYLKGGTKDYTQLILGGLIFSVAIGMVSGGLQHFLDSPWRSLWIIPVGWFISTLIYPYKEGLTKFNRNNSLLMGIIISACLGGSLYLAIHIVPEEIFGDHHTTTKTVTDQDSMMHHATITSEEQFIAEMIPHHQEAIDTSRIIVAKGTNATLKKIAQTIIDGQSNEITMLKGRLTARYPSSNYKATYKNMMRPLDKVSGHNLEDQFMEDMIKHHEGAITMAKQVLEISKKPEMVKFANGVIEAQSSEITAFKKLLDTKGRH